MASGVRVDPEVYDALVARKRGNMSISDVIAEALGLNEEEQDDDQTDFDDFEGDEDE